MAENTQRTEDKYARKFGAFWNKQGQSGDYMSGQIEINGERVNVVMFPRDNKSGNQPDWELFLNRNVDMSVLGKRVAPQSKKSSEAPAKSAPKQSAPVESDGDDGDDVPF